MIRRAFCLHLSAAIADPGSRASRDGTIRVRILRTIATPQKSLTRAVLTPDCTELYVAGEDHAITVIQTVLHKVSHVLRMGHYVNIVTGAPDGSAVYAAGEGLSVISTATKAVCRLADIAIRDALATPTGVYIAAEDAGLLLWDDRAGKMRQIDPNKAPVALTVTPDRRFLYVNYESGGPGGRFGHDAIARFDAHTGAFLESITGLANVGSYMTVAPDGKRLWASGLDACSSRMYDHAGCPMVPAGIVNVIDTASRRLLASIGLPGPYHPFRLDYLGDGCTVVLSGDGMRFVDAHTFQVTRVESQIRTRALALLPGRKRGYATIARSNQVALLAFV